MDLLSVDLRNHFDEPVQNRLVGLRETPRMWRENLQQADHAKIGRDGSRHERTYAQCATDFGIDTGIVCRILARDEQAATNAFSRQALFCVDGSSERRSWFAGSRPADHPVTREKRQGRATRSR